MNLDASTSLTVTPPMAADLDVEDCRGRVGCGLRVAVVVVGAKIEQVRA